MNFHYSVGLLAGGLLAGGLLPACEARDASSPTPPLSFTWRSAGGETTDFGGNDPPACDAESSPVTREQAIALGFDPDADRASLEAVVEADLVWSERGCYDAGTCPHSVLTQTTRVESMELFALSLHPGVQVLPGECTEKYLDYRLRMELSAADGSLAGSFPARALLPLHQLPGDSWSGLGFAALTDFRGTEQLLMNLARPHWSEVRVDAGAWGGSFEATVLYTDGAEPAEHSATRRATWSTTGPAGAYGDPLPKTPDSVALDDYRGSLLPPKFAVEARPRFDQPGAQLSVSVNGEVTHYDSIPEEQILAFGALRVGDEVSAEVTNPNGGYVDSVLKIGECTWLSAGCATPGCSARVDTTVTPKRCYPGLVD
jgi:hypothetical protein